MRSCLATGCGGFLLAVLAAVGIVGVLGYAAELGSGPGALVIATAVVPALIYTFLLLQIDRYEREPTQVLLAAFLWGALIATVVASIFNELALAVLSPALGSELLGSLVTSVAVAPVVEETAKGLILLLLAWRLRNEFDDLVDGMVYGAFVGIGFAMSENIIYFSEAFPTGELAAIFYVRVVLNGLAHAAYTALIGAGIGYARELNTAAAKFFLPLVALIGAILFHASWNLLGSISIGLIGGPSEGGASFWLLAPLVVLILTGPLLAALAVMLGYAWRREARVLTEYLEDEVAAGVLSPAVYSRITSPRARRRAEVAAFYRCGLRCWLTLRQFHQTATELAFAKWRVSRGLRPNRPRDVDELRAEVVRLGADIQTL
ncbi:MAG: PrsW family intramembrane metalloprotease [Chloroflexota bacterium]